MAIINKELAPFTYTGSWELNEYEPGKFLARLLTTGTLSPKRSFTGDLCIVNGGADGGASKNISNSGNDYISAGVGGQGGALANYYDIHVSTIEYVVIGGGASKASSFGTRIAPGNGALGGAAGLNSFNFPTKGQDGAAGSLAFEGTGYFASTRYGGGGGGGGGGTPSHRNAAEGGKGGPGGGGNGEMGRQVDPNDTTTVFPPQAGRPGQANTGGGGGGAGGFQYNFGTGDNSTVAGGVGGTGIILIRGILNQPPSDPDGIFYDAPQAGNPLILSTFGAADIEADAISYVWERRIDNGTYLQLGITTENSFTDTVPTTGSIYQARVKAVDAVGGESGYTTGAITAINHNLPPTIEMETETLGEQRGTFDIKFRVDDPNQDDVLNVSVSNDGVVFMRADNVARRTTLTATFSTETWTTLNGGSHEVTVTVDDGKVAVEERITWTKTIQGIDIVTTDPVEIDDMPKRILALPDVTMAQGATQQYYACNNGFDTPLEVVWEDITTAVLNGVAYAFTNSAKTSEKWGVCIRAVLKRQPGTTVTLRRIDGVIT